MLARSVLIHINILQCVRAHTHTHMRTEQCSNTLSNNNAMCPVANILCLLQTRAIKTNNAILQVTKKKKTTARFREKFTLNYVRNLPLNPSLTGIVDDDDLQPAGLRAVLRLRNMLLRLRGLNCGLK